MIRTAARQWMMTQRDTTVDELRPKNERTAPQILSSLIHATTEPRASPPHQVRRPPVRRYPRRDREAIRPARGPLAARSARARPRASTRDLRGVLVPDGTSLRRPRCSVRRRHARRAIHRDARRRLHAPQRRRRASRPLFFQPWWLPVCGDDGTPHAQSSAGCSRFPSSP